MLARFGMMFLAVLAVSAAQPGPQDKKLDIPDDAAVKEAEKTIKSLFKDDYAKPAAADRLALAKNLLKQGIETKDDNAARYVLFRESQDLAARSGDIETAFRAVDEMCRTYATNPLILKSAALAQVSSSPRSPEELKTLAQAYMTLAQEACPARQFDLAAKASQGALSAAKKAKDVPLSTKAESQAKAMGLIQERYEKVKKSIEALAADPNSPDANRTVGEFECLTLGDWEAGLPKIAQGSDPGLKALAAKDLSNPADGAEQAGIGDGWWDRAERESGYTKMIVRQRAAYWYRQASLKLSGLSKARVDKRLEELGPAQGPQKVDSNKIGQPGGPGSIDVTTLKAKKASVGAGSLGINSNDSGEVFTANGKECKRYFFAHAPSTLVFDIPAGARFFLATGVKRSARVEGSWKYIVMVDGKTLFESKALKEYEGAEVEIVVTLPPGAREIQLIIDHLGSDNGDHSVWANPRFHK